jgi:hypothetical protein
MLYAIDPDQVRKFGKKHGLKIYNMAFFGVRSGEFSREVIERWSLRPKLWIINVDDSFDHFFSAPLKMWWFGSSQSVPIPPVAYGRSIAWRSIARRNMRWRIEDAKAEYIDAQANSDHSFYRSIEDGSIYFGNDPRYSSTTNPQAIAVVRDQNCHASPDVISTGRNYLASIGGEAVLTLIPNSTWCTTQARELADALGKQLILPPDTHYSTVDNGGHLDRLGAASFTKLLLTELENSNAFKAISPKSGVSR